MHNEYNNLYYWSNDFVQKTIEGVKESENTRS
jgi:hypothetical protein